MHVAQKHALGREPRVRSGFGMTTCIEQEMRVAQKHALGREPRVRSGFGMTTCIKQEMHVAHKHALGREPEGAQRFWDDDMHISKNLRRVAEAAQTRCALSF